MGETDERRISGAWTFFLKFVFPAIWLGFILAWTIGVAFVSGIQNKGPSPAIGCIGLVMLGVGISYFNKYHFQLKQIWLDARCLRVSNFRESVVLPYEAVVQMTNSNDRFVVVTLQIETPFGRRFTFLPANPKLTWWPFTRGEDQVVVELRRRVEAARKAKNPKPSAGLDPHSARSPMADDELDGLL